LRSVSSNSEAVEPAGLSGMDPKSYLAGEVISLSEALFIGIDISKENNLAQFMDNDGVTISKPLSFPNNQKGLETFLKLIQRLSKLHSPSKINIGMEATGFYWWHLLEALEGFAPDTSKVQLFTINPSLIKQFKNTYPTLPKTDAIDAWVIADRLRFGRLKPVDKRSLLYAPLARLTRLRYNLKKDIRKGKNRALKLISLKFSDFFKASGKRTFNNSSLELLNDFTLEQITEKTIEELAEYILAKGNNRTKNPQEFAKAIKKAARNSYRLNSKMEDTVSVALSMTIENIRFLENQCKKIDNSIARELKAIDQTLTTIPGIGPALAAGIVSEIGGVKRFPSEKSLAKFAGLTWHKTQSGNFEAEETSLTKSGNVFLRYYLVEAANSLRLHNKEYAAYYNRKYQEATKHKHKRALVLTARKFVRLVFALLSNGQIYQEGGNN